MSNDVTTPEVLEMPQHQQATPTQDLVEGAVNYLVKNLTSANFFEVFDKSSGTPVGVNPHNISAITVLSEEVAILHMNSGISLTVDRDHMLTMLAYAGGTYHKANPVTPTEEVVEEEAVSE